MALDAANLFCLEDVSGSLFDNDIACCEDCKYGAYYAEHQDASSLTQLLEEPLEEYISVLCERESVHMPRDDYTRKFQARILDAGERKKAIGWIIQVGSLYGFGLLTAALAVNYLDRFLSFYDLPSGKAWMMQLLSVACLSMAAKMEETDVPLLLDFQVGADYLFEPRIVQKMELLLGSTMNWRMSSVTPFSYTDHLIQRLDISSKAQISLHMKLEQLALYVYHELELVEFRPSAKAAAATLYCISELWPHDFENHKDNVLSVLPEHVQISSVRCFDEMGKLLSRFGVKFSVPPSPAGVLDASFLSSNSNSDTESLVKYAGSDASTYTASFPTFNRIRLSQDQQNAPPL